MAVESLPYTHAAQLEVVPAEARWLIRDVWTRAGVGILGGQPKLGKSWLGLDIAVSAASGTPCLGHYPVEDPGAALVYLAEDALGDVRSRLDALCAHRALDLRRLDLHVITAPVLRLDQAEDQQRLAATLDTLRPRVLVLDPLVRLHRLDENASADMAVLLGALRELQRRFDVAIVLVHHASKKRRRRPGQALRGSSDLHAFVDSLAYLSQERDALQMHLEHRSAPSPEPVELRLVQGEATHLELVAPPPLAAPVIPLHQRVLDALHAAPGPLLRKQLRQQLRVNNAHLGRVLDQLQREGQLERSQGRVQSGGGRRAPTPAVSLTGTCRTSVSSRHG